MVEILLWLVPAAVVTAVTMLWVAWWGREGRGEVDRETAARRLGEALGREQKRRPGYAVARRAPDRSTGVALRRSLRPAPDRPAVVPPPAEAPAADDTPAAGEGPARDRQAS